jgi:hypothetical protein
VPEKLALRPDQVRVHRINERGVLQQSFDVALAAPSMIQTSP